MGPETVNGEVVNNNNGTFGVTYLVKKAGKYRVSVCLHGQPIACSPFVVEVAAGMASDDRFCSLTTAPTHASSCVASGPGLETPTAGSPATFILTACDEFGNQRAIGGDPFEVQLKGPMTTRGVVDDRGDGTYLVTYKSTQGGKHAVYVRVHGQDIQGSPFLVNVKPSETDSGNCVVSQRGAPLFIAGEGYVFDIISKDGFGNRRTTGGDHFDVAVKGIEGDVILSDSVIDNGDGSYTAELRLQQAGTHCVYVTLHGRLIKGAPFMVTACAASPDASAIIMSGMKESLVKRMHCNENRIARFRSGRVT